MSETKPALNYKDSGVDIDAGAALVERIKPLVKSTFRPGVLSSIGGFGGLFELPWQDYQQPILVSGTDGVGTKLKLAIEMGVHNTIGIDLVAMCVNDIIVTGAQPLFFLDYFATGKLDLDSAEQIITGIAKGCALSGAALIGGETAEMPGLYGEGDYDLAGFAVGLVEKSKLISPEHISPGDVLLGLASSGPHSNGYSLIRKVMERAEAELDAPLPDAPVQTQGQTQGQSLGQALLAPTRIYVKSLLALLDEIPVHGLAHITGGGISENLPRVLPEQTVAHIDLQSWPQPAVFRWLQQEGNIEQQEMLRTFNCGIGMVVCLPRDAASAAKALLEEQGETVFEIGEVKTGSGPASVQYSD